MSKRTTTLDAFILAKQDKQGRAPNRQRAPHAPVHDRRATELPKGVVPAACEVSDPYDDGGGKITVIRNLRGDVLAQLMARKQIEEHQFQAGRLWQGFYNAAGIGSVKAMDTTKEPVDGGGGVTEVLTDRVLISVKKLAIADRDIGLEGRYLFVDILGKGYTIEQAAAIRGDVTARGKLRWGQKFRGYLDVIAVTYGLSNARATVPA